MPEITSKHIGIAADMFGCPNRCRHCYVGRSPNRRMSEADVRLAVDRFRTFARKGKPFFEAIDVVTWRREPDFSDDYRRLYELEVELSDVKTYRAEWELMSEWRLARDPAYAPWAHSIGIRTNQTTLFGMGETHDWFVRRKGSFDDCLIAADRLLEAGIKPRWQIFFTKRILPELDDLMRLVDQLRLRERCAELDGEFVMFIHTPSPDGEGEFIEHLRPTIDDASAMPQELIESTKRHNNALCNWRTVGERVRAILASEEDECPYAWLFEGQDWFVIKPNWDVYSHFSSEDPWWKLGNLKTDTVEHIVSAYELNKTLAQHTIYNVPLRELAKRHGDPDSRLIDGGVENLWLAKYCREHWGQS